MGRFKYELKMKLYRYIPDKIKIKRDYKKAFGTKLNLDNPQTLNEKIQWLKLHDHRDLNTLLVDKYRVRDYMEKEFGKEGLVPLLFQTEDVKEINETNITTFPCVVKCNSGSGMYQIIESKENVDWKQLQRKCKKWLKNNHYWISGEWQYKNVKPCIIVEKLLQTSKGTIPNDYKLHFINGNLEFIYCSVDRNGGDYRLCYDKDWNKLPFTWVAKSQYRDDLMDTDIEKPKSFAKMVEIGSKIAKNFDYVRVDFYDCDGHLYYGEITLHHGSGYDVFTPSKYDLIYGEKLKLTRRYE